MSELSNKERVLKIAAALEELNTKVVYVAEQLSNSTLPIKERPTP